MKKTIYIMLFCLSCLTACQKGQTERAVPQDGSIWLSASISPSVTTKTAYELTTPTSENAFDAIVWASTTSCDYPYNSAAPKTGADNTVGYHTSIYFQSGTDQLLRDGLRYPANDAYVYFIGLHPNTGWSANTTGDNHNTSTSYDFHGYEDLLFAPEVSGKMSQSVANPPIQPLLHFFHLLTLLKVKVYAETADVATSSWGALTSLTLTNQQRSLQIDLTSVPNISSADFATRQGNVEAKVTFNGASSPMDFYATGTDETFAAHYTEGLELPTSATEVAYVLCQPVSATAGTEGSRSNEYVLRLSTENRSDVTVNIDLKTASDTWFTGSTMGHQFVIELRLCAGGYISASATVTDWTTGGYVIEEVTE